MRALLLSLWLLAGSLAAAQGVPALRQGAGVAVAVEGLARSLGLVVADGGSSLTVRAPGGVLTVFDGSPDGLWQPLGAAAAEEQSFSAPVVRRDDGWYLPADALAPLGVGLDGDLLRLPDGRTLTLELPAPPAASGDRFELLDLGAGVPGLRLYAAGAAGAETVSVLLVDLGLLGLVHPERQRELDAFVAGLDHDKPLYFVVTAVAEASWETSFTLEQGGRSLELRVPFRVRLLEGEAGHVGPDAPAVGLLLLPADFNLREPLTVSWGEARATVTFRR